MKTLTTIALTASLLILCLLADVRADWIHPYVSEQAGIDSLERFLVIQDVQGGTFLGYGTIVSAGDVNDDGIADLLVCRSDVEGWTDHNCYIFHGGKPPDVAFDLELVVDHIWGGNIGDVNADGYDDIGLEAASDWPPRFELHLGGPTMDNSADWLIRDVNTHVRPACDLDGDGNKEIVLADINGRFVRIYDIGPGCDTIPEYVMPDTTYGFGNNHAVGRFNADAYPDLAVAAYSGRDTCIIKFYWGGPSFDTIADYAMRSTSVRFGEFLIPIGDFNGDGYDDLFIAGGANDPYGVYFGGAKLDDKLDVILNWRGYYFPPVAAAAAGDINHDGHPDVLLSYSWPDVYLFLGGPDGDSLTDIYMEGTMIPGAQGLIGHALSGIGDFNGDGIDDFAVFSCTATGQTGISEINLFAGWDATATDVPYEYEPEVPEGYYLNANYPNPFNPSTTIEFALPEPGSATITIYNLLGQEITTLVDRELAAGSYRVDWDGRDNAGRPVASGVYLCRLEAGEFSQSRKMLLLK